MARRNVNSLQPDLCVSTNWPSGLESWNASSTFGSYVTNTPAPNDVDIILVMADDFTEHDYDPDLVPVFEHLRAQQELGASIFAVRPGFVVGETVDDFIAHWQIKRDKSQHGIVEVIPEVNQ